jgi:SAM-dependent methyltransferase
MGIESAMTGYYARRAQEYERIYHKPERQDDLQLLRAFVEQSLSGKHVLEIACGTGYWTEILARSAGIVTSLDINEEVLEIARQKHLDPHKVTFQRADVYSLPPLPRHFTGGFAGFWWSHIPKSRLRDFLVGFHRALEPGSTVVFIDNVYVEGCSTPVSHADDEGNTYQRRKLQDGSAHDVLKNFPTEQELRATIAPMASGMRVEFLNYYWNLTYTLKSEPFAE